MVNLKKIQNFIYTTYDSVLNKNVCLLMIGGSVGRGNYIKNWSDIDLLLVLHDVDIKSLQLIEQCEKHIEKNLGIEVDTMVTSKFTLEHTPPQKLHGKIKNFIFFLPKAKILIKRDIIIPPINYQKFVYGFWATYAEQEKNFFRRNISANLANKKELRKLLKKNIKIIFLLLKQGLATPKLVPSNYNEALSLAKTKFNPYIIKQLKKYVSIRINNKISTMTAKKLKNELIVSIEIFQELNKIQK